MSNIELKSRIWSLIENKVENKCKYRDYDNWEDIASETKILFFTNFNTDVASDIDDLTHIALGYSYKIISNISVNDHYIYVDYIHNESDITCASANLKDDNDNKIKIRFVDIHDNCVQNTEPRLSCSPSNAIETYLDLKNAISLVKEKIECFDEVLKMLLDGYTIKEIKAVTNLTKNKICLIGAVFDIMYSSVNSNKDTLSVKKAIYKAGKVIDAHKYIDVNAIIFKFNRIRLVPRTIRVTRTSDMVVGRLGDFINTSPDNYHTDRNLMSEYDYKYNKTA